MCVIDSPTVRVRGSDFDSDDEEEDFCAQLIGENPEHYVDAEYDVETLNGVSDIPPEFQLGIQLDMRIVPDYLGLLDTHDEGAFFMTNITIITLLSETPIREEEGVAAATT